MKIPLIQGRSNCFYVETQIFNHNEKILIDTGFSYFLCLNSNLKNLFPDLNSYTTYNTEFTLADSSRKIFIQYLIPSLKIFHKEFCDFPITFNDDESIIGIKFLELLKSELNINFQQKVGYLQIT
jgi:hypothetical protein